MSRPRALRLDPAIVRRALPYAAGPAAAALLTAILLLLERGGGHFPHDFEAAFFGLITVYAAFTGGTLVGLLAGAIGWGALSVLTSAPGIYFAYLPDDKVRLIVMAFAMPAVSLLIGWLRRRTTRDNARLREAEQMWRLLAEHVPDVVLTIDRDGDVLYLNRPLPWSGLTKAETVGRKFSDLLPSEHRASVKKMLPRVLSSGSEMRTELRLGGDDVPSAWYDLRLEPVRRDGETIATLAVLADISGRIGEEDAHERLVSLVQSSNAAIFGTTADGTITSWNPGARRMYGHEENDVIGKNLSLLMQSGLAGEEAAALLARAAAGEHIERFETVHQRKDGSLIDVSLTVSPIGRKGRLTGLAVVARDLTSQKRADAERRKTLELLAEAERIAHVGSWEWNLSTDAMTWTDELHRIYGVEPGSVKPSIDAYLRQIVPADREKVKEAVKKARASAVPFSFDHRITRADGEERVLRAHGAVHRDAAGKTSRLICTVHDVTAFRRMESALRAKRAALEDEVRQRSGTLKDTKRQLDTILAEAPIVLWSVDKDGVFTLSEGSGLSALGLKPGEVVGRSVYDVYKDEHAIIDSHRRALAGKTVRASLLAEGRTYETTFIPLKDDGGAVIGVMGVALDMTGR